MSIFGEILRSIVSNRNGVIIFYNSPIFDLIKQIRKEAEMLIGNVEAYNLFMLIKKIEKIKGDIAEVGVAGGGSAKLICEAKGNKILHLFDTFEGLPEGDTQYKKGQFPALFEKVKNYLRKYKNVHIYKGLFPVTAEPVKNRKFSFVHLDVDIYKSTLDSLTFFYSRMNKGGIIISDDYLFSKGVRKAVDGFFQDKPEPIIELSNSQCLVVKV